MASNPRFGFKEFHSMRCKVLSSASGTLALTFTCEDGIVKSSIQTRLPLESKAPVTAHYPERFTLCTRAGGHEPLKSAFFG